MLDMDEPLSTELPAGAVTFAPAEVYRSVTVTLRVMSSLY